VARLPNATARPYRSVAPGHRSRGCLPNDLTPIARLRSLVFVIPARGEIGLDGASDYLNRRGRRPELTLASSGHPPPKKARSRNHESSRLASVTFPTELLIAADVMEED